MVHIKTTTTKNPQNLSQNFFFFQSISSYLKDCFSRAQSALFCFLSWIPFRAYWRSATAVPNELILREQDGEQHSLFYTLKENNSWSLFLLSIVVKYINKKLAELKWRIDKFTLKVGDYNSHSLAIDETSKENQLG